MLHINQKSFNEETGLIEVEFEDGFIKKTFNGIYRRKRKESKKGLPENFLRAMQVFVDLR